MRLPTALLVAFLSCVGCADLSSRKAESMKLWQGVRLQTEEAPVDPREYLAARTALLLEHVDSVEQTEKGSLTLRLNGRAADGASAGAAVAVDADGYWLTAAHCVEKEPVVLVIVREGKAVAVPARVVWKGDPDELGGDAALLYAPVPGGVATLPLAAQPPQSGLVLCRGSGVGSGKWAAGRIVSVGGATDGSVGWFAHTSPLGPGDSGGPAVLIDGTLGGINVSVGELGGRNEAMAVWVSPARVRELISDDRAGRAAGGKGDHAR